MYPSGSKIEQVCCGPFRTLRVSQDQGFTACVEFTWATALPLWAVYVCVCVCVGGGDLISRSNLNMKPMLPVMMWLIWCIFHPGVSCFLASMKLWQDDLLWRQNLSLFTVLDRICWEQFERISEFKIHWCYSFILRKFLAEKFVYSNTNTKLFISGQSLILRN